MVVRLDNHRFSSNSDGNSHWLWAVTTTSLAYHTYGYARPNFDHHFFGCQTEVIDCGRDQNYTLTSVLIFGQTTLNCSGQPKYSCWLSAGQPTFWTLFPALDITLVPRPFFNRQLVNRGRDRLTMLTRNHVATSDNLNTTSHRRSISDVVLIRKSNIITTPYWHHTWNFFRDRN